MYARQRLLILVILVALILAGCQFGPFGAPAAPKEAPNAEQTASAATLVAQLTRAPTATRQAPAPTLPPAPTAAPTQVPPTQVPPTQPPPQPVEPTAPAQPVEPTPTAVPPAQNAEPTALPEIAITQIVPLPEAPVDLSAETGGGAPAPTPIPLPVISAVEPAAMATSTVLLPTPSLLLPPSQFVEVYRDDFAQSRFWHVETTANWSLSYGKGGYRILSNALADAVWSVRDEPYGDVIAEIEASKIEGPRDGAYGLVCRYQDAGHYYALLISGDGQYGIYKKADGKLNPLAISDKPTPLIKFGTALNKIRADCVGTTLSLSVNDTLLVQAQDEDFLGGLVGMAVMNRTTTGTWALFDNLVVYAPVP